MTTRSLLDCSTDLLVMLCDDGTIQDCNRTFADAVGGSVGGLQGELASRHIVSKLRKRFESAIQKARATGSAQPVKADLSDKQGNRRPITWTVTPLVGCEYVALAGRDTLELDILRTRLDEAERRFSSFTDSLPGIAFIKDRTRRLTYVSKRFGEVFDCPPAQGVGRRDEDFLPRPVAFRNKTIETTIFEQGGYDARIEEDEAVLNGKRWMIHRFAIGEGADRKLGGLSLEISGLTEAEERFRAFYEASLDAIAILQPIRNSRGKVEDFSFNYTNKYAAGIFGPTEDIHGSFRETVANTLPADFLPALIRIVETGLPYETEFKAVDPCIGERSFHVRAFRAGGFVGIDARDVTTEKAALSRSQMASLRFKTLFDGNPAACMTLDLEGKVVDWNRKCEEVYGYTKAEVKGKAIIDLVVDESTRQIAHEANAETQRKGGLHQGSEWCVKRKDGSTIWVFSSTIPLHDNNGELAGLVSSNIDITTLKHTEAALRTSNSDLEQFANVASHDLLEPLRMVCCYMDLLESQYSHRLDDEGREFLRFALDGGLRMREMIKSLLEFSQVGKVRSAPSTVNMTDVVEQALENLNFTLQQNPDTNIVVGQMPVLLGSKPELVRLMQNLVANSLKFRSSASCEIHVSSLETPSGFEFVVKDNGIGIDPRFQDKVFKLFQRLHHQTDYEGSGIGLSVCRKIVEQHGGQIWVGESVSGCEIHFTLSHLRCDAVAIAA